MSRGESEPTGPAHVEDDPRFPSGPWTGFYNYGAQVADIRFRQEMMLTFRAGELTGDGYDGVGSFLIRGGYDTAGGKAWWTKTYPGSHDVSYSGYRESRGIWGTWEIRGYSRGGFMIWPKGLGDEAALEAEAADGIAAEATTTQPAARVSLGTARTGDRAPRGALPQRGPGARGRPGTGGSGCSPTVTARRETPRSRRKSRQPGKGPTS